MNLKSMRISANSLRERMGLKSLTACLRRPNPNEFSVDFYFDDSEETDELTEEIQKALEGLVVSSTPSHSVIFVGEDQQERVLLKSFMIEVKEPGEAGNLLTDLMRLPDRPPYSRIRIESPTKGLVGDTNLSIPYID